VIDSDYIPFNAYFDQFAIRDAAEQYTVASDRLFFLQELNRRCVKHKAFIRQLIASIQSVLEQPEDDADLVKISRVKSVLQHGIIMDGLSLVGLKGVASVLEEVALYGRTDLMDILSKWGVDWNLRYQCYSPIETAANSGILPALDDRLRTIIHLISLGAHEGATLKSTSRQSMVKFIKANQEALDIALNKYKAARDDHTTLQGKRRREDDEYQQTKRQCTRTSLPYKSGDALIDSFL
jgi:hypothetical protein